MFINFLKCIINLVLDLLFIIDLYNVFLDKAKGFWYNIFLIIILIIVFALFDSFIGWILNRTYKND